jgi:hypothetical protein
MDRLRGSLGGIASAAAGVGRQRAWIRIEAETDLAAALDDERSEPVRERLRARASRP